MKLYQNEKGVSEVVGAMLVLLIMVIFLGTMQAYEVPRWNKELEKQEFDLVYSDFLNFKSNLEDASIKNIPRTMSMHTGVRYPERFMLRNPGQGAYGTFTTYPLKINISYNSNGTISYKDYTSLGMVYEMKGTSDFPKLVYEHGIVIKEFGNWNYSDDENHIAKDNGIYIPLLKGIEPLSSTEVETFNILPISDFDITNAISSINVTLETRYPGIWVKMLDEESIPTGSNITNNNTEIRITDISGFNIRNLSLPNTSLIFDNNIYSGTIRFADANTVVNAIKINMEENITNTITNNITNNVTNNITNNITNYISVFSVSSNCSNNGFYIWDISQGCLNLPTSQNVTKFIIRDMKFGGNTTHQDIIFNVRDAKGDQFMINLDIDSNANGNPTSMYVQQINVICPNPSLLNGEINLTSCYNIANISSPNVLKITTFEPGILFVDFLVK